MTTEKVIFNDIVSKYGKGESRRYDDYLKDTTSMDDLNKIFHNSFLEYYIKEKTFPYNFIKVCGSMSCRKLTFERKLEFKAKEFVNPVIVNAAVIFGCNPTKDKSKINVVSLEGIIRDIERKIYEREKDRGEIFYFYNSLGFELPEELDIQLSIEQDNLKKLRDTIVKFMKSTDASKSMEIIRQIMEIISRNKTLNPSFDKIRKEIGYYLSRLKCEAGLNNIEYLLEAISDNIDPIRYQLQYSEDIAALDEAIRFGSECVEAGRIDHSRRTKLYPLLYCFVNYLAEIEGVAFSSRSIIIIDSCMNRLDGGSVTLALPKKGDSKVLTAYTPFIMGSPYVDIASYDAAHEGYQDYLENELFKGRKTTVIDFNMQDIELTEYEV